MFFAVGVESGAWAACIPELKRTLALSDARLGLALLAVAGGALVAMPAAGWLAGRVGTRRATALLALASAAALVLPALAPSFGILLATAAVFGVGTGGVDAAMNAHATAVEHAWGTPVMSSFHAFFSLGGLAGATVAGLALGHGAGGTRVLIGAAVAALGLVAVSSGRLHVAATGTEGGHAFAWPRREVVGVGLLALLCLLAEGAMADWSAVYLRRAGAAAGAAAAGYAAFSLAMAAGRLTGDRVVARLGGPRVLRIGGVTAALGLGVALGIPDARLAAAGFALVGIGLANVVPVLFTTAGRLGGATPGIGVAMVATFGYTGLLAGPPLIGFAAQAVGLRMALAIPAAGCLVIAGLAALAGESAGRGSRTEDRPRAEQAA